MSTWTLIYSRQAQKDAKKLASSGLGDTAPATNRSTSLASRARLTRSVGGVFAEIETEVRNGEGDRTALRREDEALLDERVSGRRQ